MSSSIIWVHQCWDLRVKLFKETATIRTIIIKFTYLLALIESDLVSLMLLHIVGAVLNCCHLEQVMLTSMCWFLRSRICVLQPKHLWMCRTLVSKILLNQVIVISSLFLVLIYYHWTWMTIYFGAQIMMKLKNINILKINGIQLVQIRNF